MNDAPHKPPQADPDTHPHSQRKPPPPEAVAAASN